MPPVQGGRMRRISFVAYVANKLEGKCCGGGDDKQCDDEQHGLSPLCGLAVEFLNNTV
jgi:hypothetical protein